MKGKTSFWMQFFALAAGIVLICMHDRINLVQWVIVFVGVMFAIPGLFGLIEALVGRRKSRRGGPVPILASVGSLIIGVIMIVCPVPFEAVFVYFLSAVLILGGIWHIWILSVGVRPIVLPVWLYVLPVLVVIAGISILLAPVRETESIFTLIAGIALVCIAGNGLFIYLAAYGQHRRTDADSDGDERRLDADVRRLDADVTSVKKTDGSDIPAGWE